jgi:hypothetical protein
VISPKVLDRYAKLVALAADEAAALQERQTAGRKLRELEAAHPTLRAEWAHRTAKKAPPPSRTPDAPLADFWKAQGYALYGAVREQFAHRAGALAESTVEQITATVVQGMDHLFAELENVMSLLTETADFGDNVNLGTVKWHKAILTAAQVQSAYEKTVVEGEEGFDVVEGSTQYGDLACLDVQVPLGLLLRCGEDPTLAHALVLALIEDLRAGEDVEDEDEEALFG